MKETLFAIQPQCWIACRTIPDLQIGWSAMTASPGFVTDVQPLKTGKGILRLTLIPLLYPTGPSEIQIDLRIIHRRDDYLVGICKDFGGAERTLILETISFKWLEQHCPRYTKGWRQAG